MLCHNRLSATVNFHRFGVDWQQKEHAKAMENPSQKCEICAEAGPNQTKLPRHYIRKKFKAETHLDLSGEDLCDTCLFEIER